MATTTETWDTDSEWNAGTFVDNTTVSNGRLLIDEVNEANNYNGSWESEVRNYGDTQALTELTIDLPVDNDSGISDVVFEVKDGAGNTLETNFVDGDGVHTIDISGAGEVDNVSLVLFLDATDRTLTSPEVASASIGGVGAPQGLSASPATDPGSIDLSWTDESAYAEYAIYRAEASGSIRGDYTQIDTVTTGSYTDTGLTDGHTYHYRIVGVTADGVESPLSEEVSATTAVPAPAWSLTPWETAIDVSVTPQDNNSDASYELYVSTTDGTLGNVESSWSSTGEQTYTAEPYPNGETVYVTLRTTTPDSTADSDQEASTTVLPPPSNLNVDAINGDQFEVSWRDNAADEDGYRVFVSRDRGETWTQDSSDLAPDTESYTTTALLDGERYLVTVEAFTADATARDIEPGAARDTGEYGGQLYGRGRPPVGDREAGEYGGHESGYAVYGGS